MKLECISNALNIRSEPHGKIIAELRMGNLFEVPASKAFKEWVSGTALTGVSTGIQGYVRRKWLIQHFSSAPAISPASRAAAASIVDKRTTEFDAVTYRLGDKARSWNRLQANGVVDCSGWVYLLAREILQQYGLKTQPRIFDTFSDEQLTNAGATTKAVISAGYIADSLVQPGVIMGIDFAEYSWDRGRPLDIDHIVMVGEDSAGRFVSQSSSSGGGVNRVPLSKWMDSQKRLISEARVHLVDLLSLP